MITLRPMLSFMLLGTLSVVAMSCSTVEQTPNAEGEPDRSADEAAIRAKIAANEAATNRRDAAGVAATFVPDGDIWIVGDSRISGLDEIRRNEEAFYSTPGFQEWHSTIETIRFISPNMALVESTSVTTLDAGKIRSEETLVLTRRNGDWRFTAVRVMSLKEQP